MPRRLLVRERRQEVLARAARPGPTLSTWSWWGKVGGAAHAIARIRPKLHQPKVEQVKNNIIIKNGLLKKKVKIVYSHLFSNKVCLGKKILLCKAIFNP